VETAVEELTDILVGLEQRISAYKNRYQELEKKRRRLDDEIATIKKYLELAETLYRVEADKAKLASLSNHHRRFQRIPPGSGHGRHRSIA
jgi:chromosome segregation ATPase